MEPASWVAPQMAGLLAVVGACFSFWTWRRMGWRAPLLSTLGTVLTVLALISAATARPLLSLAMLGAYICAGFALTALRDGRGPSRWDWGERTLLALGAAMIVAGW